jgi:hypothetical protein
MCVTVTFLLYCMVTTEGEEAVFSDEDSRANQSRGSSFTPQPPSAVATMSPSMLEAGSGGRGVQSGIQLQALLDAQRTGECF